MVRDELGKYLYRQWFCDTALETIPKPTSVTLDDETGILDWTHPFHPADLPVDFQIIHEFGISYLINETDSGERGQTMVSHETSLGISHVLDYCKRQEFTVQTVVNDLYHSQNSSYNTNSTGEGIPRPSASDICS